MGAMTFANMKTYLKMQFRNNTDLESPTNYYGIWINLAYKELETKNRLQGLKVNFYFPELRTSTSSNTTDGTKYISVPSDAVVVEELYDTTSNYHLVNIPFSEYVAYTDRSTAASEGKPTEWVRHGSNLYLHPTPDNTYAINVWYQKISSDLSADADTTDLGEEWDNIILDMAYIKGKEWMSEFDKADRREKQVAQQIAGLIGIYYKEELARDPRMKPEAASLMYGRK